MAARYRFDRFELDADERDLRRAGQAIPLQDLPLRLLIALVEQAPATVSREELRESLWPPETHLDVDASLNTAVARVREALGDDASAPRFVVTVPRRGYRFVAPVEAGLARRRAAWPVAAALGIVLVAAGVAYVLRFPEAGGGPGPATSLSADVDRGAREYLLVGRHQTDRRSRDGLEKAIAAFQSAAALAPASAEAYSGLASSYALLGIYDYWRPREAFGPAEVMARRALELDPESAEAHLAMGLVAAVAHWDWPAATAAVERAVALAPDSPEVWFWRAGLLSALGRHDEAIASGRRALELDPTSPVINTGFAWFLFLARRDDEAVAQAHRALELFPDYYDAWDNLKWIEVTLGHRAAALEAWVKAEELAGGGGSGVRRAFAAGGLENLHRESIKRLTARWEAGGYQSPYDIVLEHAALGEVGQALVWLERSFAERETDLVGLGVDPRVDVLRHEARFHELLEEIGGNLTQTPLPEAL